jgi:DNA-binding GntR family transcriptional regulator
MNADKLQLYLDQNPFSKLNDVVYKLLYDEILSLNLAPSIKINIKQITESLNISRTPVVDALNRLYSIGIVEMHPDITGYFVSELSLLDMTNLYHTRAAIECEAAYRCAKKADSGVIQKLKQLATDFEKAMLRNDRYLVRELDLPFHKIIVESCHDKYLEQSYAQLLPNLVRYQRYCTEFIHSDIDNPWSSEISHQHCAIVSAIKLHIPEMARQCMDEHINLCIYHAAFSHTGADPFKASAK